MATGTALPSGSSVGGDTIAGDQVINQSAGGDIVGRDKITTNIQQLYARALSAAEASEQERDFELKRLAQGVGELVQRLQGSAGGARPAGAAAAQPYKGLLEYRLADAEIFFGRARAVNELRACLARAPLTILHSESGAGKSSLIQAGLAPGLIAAGHLPVFVRPYNAEPGYVLKRAFLPDPSLAPGLATAPLRDFLLRVNAVLPSATLYICLDQFEEFFTQLADPERDNFIGELAECLDDPSLNVRWLLSLRTEFFGRLGSFRPRVRSPFENDFRLSRLTRDEAEEVIVQPALRRGVSFEAGLVQTLLDDLGDGQGRDIAPPQLQLVCSALFAELAPGETSLTRAVYEREGGVAGILRGHLERVLSRDLMSEQRAPARRVLESLVSSEQQRLVRPRTELAAELAQRGVSPEMLAAVLDQLQASRLIKPSTTDAGEAYELAHDYLLSEIKLDPEVQARKAAQELLEQELRAFNRYKTLLSLDRLKVIDAYRADLQVSPQAEQLLNDSRQAAQAQAIAEQERQQKDIEEARELARETEARRQAEAARAQEAEQSAARLRTRNRILRVVTIAAVLALIAASFLWYDSNREADRADANAARAEANAAQAEANAALADTAAATAVAAAATSSAAEARALSEQAKTQRLSRLALSRELASRAAQVLPYDTELATLLAAAALSTTYSADGVYTGEALAAMGQVLAQPPPLRDFGGHASILTAVAFDRNGARLLTGDGDGLIQVWDVVTGTRLFQVAALPGPVRSLSVSPDGASLLTLGQENAARLWSAADGSPLRVLEGHTGLVVSAEFSAAGDRILTASQDGTARVWDGGGNFLFALAGHPLPLTVGRFSPDGNRLVTADEGGGVRLWAADGTPLAELGVGTPPTAHTQRVTDIVFNRQGLFVTLSNDGSARLWQADGAPMGELRGQLKAMTSAAFHPFLPLLATGNADGTVWVWQFSDRVELVQQMDAYLGQVYSVRYSPDGTRLLTAGCDASGSSDLVDRAGNSLCDQSSAILWDQGGRLLATLRQQRWTSLAEFSPAGDQLLTAGCAPAARSAQDASACTEGDAWLWGLDSFRLSTAGTGRVSQLEFNAAHNELLAVVDNQPQLYQSADGRSIGPVGSPQSGATYSPDGRYLLTLTNEQVQVWDTAQLPAAQPVTQRNQGDLPFDSAWFSPGGQWVVLELAGKVYELWPAPGQPAADEPATQYAQSIFSGDGGRLLTVDFDGEGQLWQADVGGLVPLGRLDDLAIPLASASFSRDGAILLTLSEEGVGQLWDGVLGLELPAIEVDLQVTYGSVDATGTRIVVGALESMTAVLLDTAGTLVRDLDPPTFAGWDMFSPGGDRLLTWRCAGMLRSSGCLKLLDGQTGAEIAILDSPGEIMSSAQFSADGRWLFTPYLSGAVGVWDRDGYFFARLPGAYTSSRLPMKLLVAANVAGTRLATGGSNAPVQLLQLYPDTRALLAEAARRTRRALTSQECAQYLHLPECP